MTKQNNLQKINNNRLEQYLMTDSRHRYFSFNMWVWFMYKNPKLFKYIPTCHSNYRELKELYGFLTI